MTGLRRTESRTTGRRTRGATSKRAAGASTTIPQPLSVGEETLARDLTAYKIPFQREVCLIEGRKWRWDFVVGKLAIEIHGGTWSGGRHSRGSGQHSDFAKQNAVVRAGYLPLVYTTAMVTDGTAIAEILEVWA